MNYKKFKEEFISNLMERKNLGFLPVIQDENQTEKSYINLGEDLFISINLFTTYEKFLEHRNMEYVLDKICKIKNNFFTKEYFLDNKKNFRVHLKTDSDQKLYCKKFLDLEFIFYVEFDYGFFNGTMPVTCDIIRAWNLSENEFIEEVLNNQNPIISFFKDSEFYLFRYKNWDERIKNHNKEEIFVNGIDVLLNNNILQSLYDINHTDFYIISSGEKQVQIIFDNETDERAWYVYDRHIETSTVARICSPEEYLINSVYYYHGESKEVTLINMKEVLV